MRGRTDRNLRVRQGRCRVKESAKAHPIRQHCINPTCQREFSTFNQRKKWCTAGCRVQYRDQQKREARRAERAALEAQ